MPHPLTNFEIERYQNNTRFNDVYSRDNVPNKMKDEVNIINHLNMPVLALYCFVCER